LLSAESLDGLIAPFVDEAMLKAIATEHNRGRRLLVATTEIYTTYDTLSLHDALPI
jgi:hypothetical protein